MISNELPNLGEASAAIIGRIVLLILSRSWLGKEDHQLEPALHAELPAILNWSLDGLRRLAVDNRPARSPALPRATKPSLPCAISPRQSALSAGRNARSTHSIRSLSTTFIREFNIWSEDNGHRRATKQAFGRDLHAAVPTVRVTRPRDDPKRSRVCIGIGLRP